MVNLSWNQAPSPPNLKSPCPPPGALRQPPSLYAPSRPAFAIGPIEVAGKPRHQARRLRAERSIELEGVFLAEGINDGGSDAALAGPIHAGIALVQRSAVSLDLGEVGLPVIVGVILFAGLRRVVLRRGDRSGARGEMIVDAEPDEMAVETGRSPRRQRVAADEGRV